MGRRNPTLFPVPPLYGRKGGDSPTAGKKATRYRANLPDGLPVTKRSFHEDTPTAWFGAYQHETVWHVAGVWPTREAVPAHYQAIEAERVPA